ncbi:MAG TPA: extracellular solute-binding protein [Spirochaetia bacterium]|nr:extracellular solute-binding protein [Spirochaetia bacterium]
MKKFALSLGAAMLAAVALVSCGAPAASKDLSVFNWQDYIPDDVLKDFQAQTGIKLVYDTYGSNEDMYAKLLGGATYDVVFPSTDYVPRMVQKDMLLKLDASKLPELANLEPSINTKNSWDPKNEYSVPYNLGSTAIVYWKDKVKVDDPSWGIFSKPEYALRIMLLDDPREILGAALKFNGFSVNSTSADEITKAKSTVNAWKKGVVKFDNDLIKSAFAKKEIWIALNYPENQYAELDPADKDKVGLFFPKEGGMLYIDTMTILKGAKNVDNAYAFINFILKPENLAKIYDNYGYPGVLYPKTTPFRKVPPTYTANDLTKHEVRGDVGEALKLYESAYEEIKASK